MTAKNRLRVVDVAKPALRRWLQANTFPHRQGDLDELARVKQASGSSVCVCLPALNEAETIGPICSTISQLVERRVVDELVVVDSGSVDSTAAIAQRFGARLVDAKDVLPDFGPVQGKGDVLWRSLATCEHDVIVWVDSDTRNFDVHFITNLLGPLLATSELAMVKAFYERPLVAPTGLVEGGARVTELVARPLINLLWPELAGFIQPLSGEYAIRREIALDVPFLTGYAVDLGLLVDVSGAVGVERVAQADLGMRIHRNQPLPALGRMASQVLQGALRKLEEHGRLKVSGELDPTLIQFAGHQPNAAEVTVDERPPMHSVLGR